MEMIIAVAACGAAIGYVMWAIRCAENHRAGFADAMYARGKIRQATDLMQRVPFEKHVWYVMTLRNWRSLYDPEL